MYMTTQKMYKKMNVILLQLATMFKLRTNNKYQYNQELSLSYIVRTGENEMFLLVLKHVEESKIQIDYW